MAPPRGGPRLTDGRSAPLRRTLPILLATAAALAAAACGPAPAPDVVFEWRLAPSPPVVGDALLTLHVQDRSGQPVQGAALRVEGHMSHPGMAPVVAQAAERQPGVYEASMAFTMRGDWILLVTGTLSSGEPIEHRIDVRGVQPPAE
ncbi:MAG TPA: FixH family protein [Vicinamibacterales bacterium]